MIDNGRSVMLLLAGALIWLPSTVSPLLDEGHNFDMNNYFRMPPLYQMDDYDRCFGENPPTDEKVVYCFARSQIQPNESSEVWDIIQNFSADHKRHFRHDRLVRGVCLHWCKPHYHNYVPSAKRRYLVTPFDNTSEITYDSYSIEGGMLDRIKYDKWTNLCINWELKHKYDLKAYSRVEYCVTSEEKPRYEIDSIDLTFVAIVLVLIGTIVASSSYDYYLKRRYILTPVDDVGHYRNQAIGKFAAIAVSFSLPRNWHRLMSESNAELAQDLRPINAMRFLTMFCVILGHCVLLMNALPTSNPQYMEQNYYRLITQLLINGPTVIQTFFVITGYMLSTHFMQLRANTTFQMRYLWQTIVYRYLRLTPVYMFVLLFDATWLVRLQDGPVWLHTVGAEQTFCRQSWWTNILYINNMMRTTEPCFQHGWYLAADFQLFVVGVVLHMMFWRFPSTTKLLMSAGLAVAVAVPGLITYTQRFEGIFMATPESQRYLQWYDVMYRMVYIPAYTNAGSFLCGLCGGIVYAQGKREQRPLGQSVWLRLLYWTAVPAGVVLLLSGYVFYAYEVAKPAAWVAAYAAAQKTVWGAMMATIITAMAFGIGWIFKDMMCHPVFRPLGRITYCAYLVHPTVIRICLGTMRQPVYASDNMILMNTLSVLVISYEVAFVLAICLEFPLTSLLQHFGTKNLKSKHDGARMQGNMLELNITK